MASSSTSLTPTSNAPEETPYIERVDGLALEKKDLKRRRFNITINSVHFYPYLRGSLCCAILIKTEFQLHSGEKLAHAIVPLSACPQKAEAEENTPNDSKPVEISEHYPSVSQWTRVARKLKAKEVHKSPRVDVNVLGNGVGLGGVGSHTSGMSDKSYLISLEPSLYRIKGYSPYLDWKYEDVEGIFYPPSTDLLVIVKKEKNNSAPHDSNPHSDFFPFELRLEFALQVDVHGLKHHITRLVSKTRPQHDGRCFQIKGQYNSPVAAAALDAARENPQSMSVGLHAAARDWLSIYANDAATQLPVAVA